MADEKNVSVKNYWDYYSTMTTAINKSRAEGIAEGMAKGMAEGMEKGMAEGMAEGMAKGETKANRENARKMKELGGDTDFISQITGLTAEEIEAL